MKVLSLTLQFIGVIQIILGCVFLFFPIQYGKIMNLPTVPAWGLWLFTMMAARFIGYGIGMLFAARDPNNHILWIDTMILIQAIDWISTLYFLSSKQLKITDVTTAAFLPVLFIVILSLFRLNILD